MSAGPEPPRDKRAPTPPASLSDSLTAPPAPAESPAESSREPVNPFYALLLLSSVAFVLTGLVLSLVPWPELPGWLRQYGWQIVLVEMALVIVTGLASMALDRWRSWRR